MNARRASQALRSAMREIALSVTIFFALLQIFDALFPYLVTDLIGDYRVLAVLGTILASWVLIETYVQSREAPVGGEENTDL